MKGLIKMLKTLEDITELNSMIEADLSHDEVLKKYWGDCAWSSMFGDDEEIENSLMYAVYNDEIDDSVQLGTLTEILDENNNVIDYIIYRTVI